MIRTIGRRWFANQLREWRISRKPSQTFPPEEASQFLFFQFNCGNAEYFFREHNNTRICVFDTPHYQVARQFALKEELSEVKKKYLEYLQFSWPSHDLEIGTAKIEARYERFLNQIQLHAKTGKCQVPVLLTTIPGKQGYYIVDGNHRCAIACALDLPVVAKLVDFFTTFDHYMQVAEFYGTANHGMPYQSVYINRQIVRPGRRDDIYERLGLLPNDILLNKTVLDVGSNLGMNAIGAYKHGAKQVFGLEVSKKMANFATRFSMLDDSYPNVTFRQFDVDKDILPVDEKYDVAFMFSVLKHLRTADPLIELANRNITQALVFEGHPNTTMNDYEKFFQAIHFSKIDKLADLGTSVFDRTPARPLWVSYK